MENDIITVVAPQAKDESCAMLKSGVVWRSRSVEPSFLRTWPGNAVTEALCLEFSLCLQPLEAGE